MRTNDSAWTETFRTIVYFGYANGRGGSTIYGPFATKGAAKAAGTRASKDHAGKVMPGYAFTVERAATAWEHIA